MESARQETPERQSRDYKPSLDPNWIAAPLLTWCRVAGISRSHAYALAAAGKLKITHLGNRALVTRAESDRVLREGV